MAKPSKEVKISTCPVDKSKCDCYTICPSELAEDCIEKGDPQKCCQGCMAGDEESENE